MAETFTLYKLIVLYMLDRVDYNFPDIRIHSG